MVQFISLPAKLGIDVDREDDAVDIVANMIFEEMLDEFDMIPEAESGDDYIILHYNEI